MIVRVSRRERNYSTGVDVPLKKKKKSKKQSNSERMNKHGGHHTGNMISLVKQRKTNHKHTKNEGEKGRTRARVTKWEVSSIQE